MGQKSSSFAYKWSKTKLLMFRLIHIFILSFTFFSCKSQIKKTPFKNLDLPITEYQFKSLLPDTLSYKKMALVKEPYEILPIGKIVFNDSIESLVYAYGKIGVYGTFADGELKSPIIKMKVFKNQKITDSLLVEAQVFGEGVTQTKNFEVTTNKVIKVRTHEEWEDLETGEINESDKTDKYIVENNGLIAKLE